MTDIALFGISIKGIASSLFMLMLHELESGVEGVVSDVLGKALTATTSAGLTGSSWLSGVAGAMVPVEEMVVAPLLFVATIGAVLRQDMRRLARAWLVCLPVSLIGGFAVVKLAALGLSVTDAISSAVQAQVAPHLGSLFVKVLTAGLVASAASGLLGFFLCAVFLFGALAIWIELAMRSACVEMAVFFMPLAFAGLVWPATAHWAKRMVELLASLLLAKPVIVGALCLGARALGSMSGLSAAVEGATILLMATFAPWAVLKLVPMVETSTVGHLQGISSGPLRAMENAKRAAAWVGAAVSAGTVTAAAAAGEAGATMGSAGPGGGPSGGAAYLLSQLGGRAGWSRVARDPYADEDPLGPAGPPKGVGGADHG